MVLVTYAIPPGVRVALQGFVFATRVALGHLLQEFNDPALHRPVCFASCFSAAVVNLSAQAVHYLIMRDGAATVFARCEHTLIVVGVLQLLCVTASSPEVASDLRARRASRDGALPISAVSFTSNMMVRSVNRRCAYFITSARACKDGGALIQDQGGSGGHPVKELA